MQFYQCKVRLMGSLLHEVFKPEVSAPEIMILRALHGSDAVVDIVRTRIGAVSNDDERERLLSLYMDPKVHNAEQMKVKNGIWQMLFGPITAQLPTKLTDQEYPELPGEPPRATDKRSKREIQRAAKEAAEALEPDADSVLE